MTDLPAGVTEAMVVASVQAIIAAGYNPATAGDIATIALTAALAGRVVVPREATFLMSDKGQGVVNLAEINGQYECLSRDEIDAIYRAMIAAAGQDGTP
jgi:hypothetical protein